MANVQITQLPNAEPLTGFESVPVVQNGITVKTTTGAIANAPILNQTFLTVNLESTLPNSRYFSTDNSLTITDNGAQSYYRIGLTGAVSQLNTIGNGFVVKTGATTLQNRSIAVANAGLSITNGDGISGNPTLSLSGLPLILAQASGSGLLSLDSGSTLSPVAITGTAGQISVANGTGVGGNPTLSLSTTGVVAGSYTTANITVDAFGRITSAANGALAGTVTSVSVDTANGFAGNVSNPTTTPAIEIQTTVTGIIKGNGTAISAATSGVDYAPATSGTSILYGDGSGGFSNVTVGTGLTFAGGTLSATGSGTVTSVTASAPLSSSGGSTPNISITQSGVATDGYLSSTDWNTFNNKAPATSGTSILYGNGSGGFSNVTVGTGLSFSGGILSNTAPDQTVSLTAGTAISISGTYPSFTITNTAPDQIVSLTGAGTTTVTGTYPNFTITSTGGTGGGDVTGPASSTDNAITRFDGTTGKIIQNSTVTLSDTGDLSGVNSIVTPDYITFDTTAAATSAVAKLFWDDGDGVLSNGLKGGNVTLQIGTQEYARVYNDSGTTLTKGQVVYISGAQGNRIAVKLARADVEATSFGTIGLVAETITNGAEGYIIVSGALYKLDTTGLTAGASVYLSPTTAGAITTTKPQAPDQMVVLGWVERVDNIVGSIYVKIDNGYELEELHDVRITSPVSGNLLIYDASTSPIGVWKNASLTAGTGISVTNGAGSVTVTNTAPDQVVSLTAGTGINVSGTYPSFTVTNSAPDQVVSLTAGANISITGTYPSFTIAATGLPTGDVVGPASSTDNAIARFDGTTGKLIQNSAVTIADDGATVIDVNSTSAGLRITQIGTGNAILVEDSANPDASPFVVDASGNVGVGTSTPTSFVGSGVAVVSTSSFAPSSAVVNKTNDSGAGAISLLKDRANAIVNSGDSVGFLNFRAYDGASYIEAARITGAVDGTPGTNDMPGRLVFSTTADGASSPTERMRINSKGQVSIGGVSPSSSALLAITGTSPGTGTTIAGIYSDFVAPATATTSSVNFWATPATAAASFTISQLIGYYYTPNTFGAGSTVTSQYGFWAASMTGATNNYGFFASTAAATGRWNFYASGTAQNYFAGNVGIGSGKTVPATALDVNGTITATALDLTTPLAVTDGGTGQSSYTDGELLIGNSTGNTLTKATLTAGSGISITNGSGSITIAATGGAGVSSFSAGTTGFTPNTATTGAVTLAGTLALTNGGTGATSAPAANANLTGFTSTATAAGTTTLTNTSSYYQLFTGSTTQTVELPVTSTLTTGWSFHIVNNSTGNLTVNSSGGNLVITVLPGTTVMVTCIGTTLTTAADWEAGYTDFSTARGTGAVVLANPLVSSTTSITSPLAWNSDNFDLYAATAQAGALTINADAGTPVNGRKVTFRLTCDGTARTITFTGGASKAFKPVGVTLTTSGSNFTYTLTINKTTYFGAIYNAASDRWEIVALSQEA